MRSPRIIGLTESRIMAACRYLSSGQASIKVRLADLRTVLPEIQRDHLNSALVAMQRRGKLSLWVSDAPEQRDDEAAIDIGGFPKHVVYLESPGT